MIQMKLNLKSKHASRVFANNGKSYKLQPGSNTLNLEYEDYISLATALGIKPIELPKEDEDKASTVPVEDHADQIDNKESQKEIETVEEVKEETNEQLDTPASSIEELEQPETTDNVSDDKQCDTEETKMIEEVSKPVEVDYSTWSYSKLKAEYKSVTGNTCKLKKDEIIAFLQEHNSHV